MVKVCLVMARALNGIIGAGNDLPWRLSGDLKYFRKLTMAKPVVMGRKTFDSIGKPLDGRDNIVISRREDFVPEGVFVADSVAAALDRASIIAQRDKVNEIMVIGGAQIFAETLDLADKVYLSEVHAEPEGDTHMPDFDPAVWRETAREDFKAGEKDSADYSFVVLERSEA